METKTSKAIALLHSGCLKEALAIFSTFRIGFTKDERRTLKISYECLSGNAGFYRQLGTDTSAEIEKSKSLLLERYGKRGHKKYKTATEMFRESIHPYDNLYDFYQESKDADIFIHCKDKYGRETTFATGIFAYRMNDNSLVDNKLNKV